MSTRRALIIGGSLGGLLAAHLLRDAGWDVVVFERNAEDLTGRGAGISTHPQLIDILRRVGIAFDESMGIKVDTVICLDRSGHTYLREPTLADHELVGAALSLAARPAAAGELPPGHVAAARRAGRRRRHRGVRRRHARHRRPAGRRRRLALHRARAAPARPRAQLRRLRRLARHAGRERGAARHPRRALRALHVLPARGRAASGLSGAGPQQRDAARPPRLQHRLVPAGRPRQDAGRSLHRRQRPLSRHVDPAAADPARGHGRHQGDRARAGGAAGRGDFRARAAVLPADLRSRVAADRVRTGGAAGRRRVRGAAACRRRRHQGGARCRQPGRGLRGRRPRSRPRPLPEQAAAVRQLPGRARTRGRRLSQRAAQAARATQRGRAAAGISTTCCWRTIRAPRTCARRWSRAAPRWPTNGRTTSSIASVVRHPSCDSRSRPSDPRPAC